jgi:hypothetical protein
MDAGFGMRGQGESSPRHALPRYALRETIPRLTHV